MVPASCLPTPESDLCRLVVLESSNCWMAELDCDTALTVIGLVSEDPSNWAEAMSVWPRYRTPAVCEFASNLLFAETERETALKALLDAEAWVVIDFESKRVLSGGAFQELGPDAALAMVIDDRGKQHSPLSIHLPPWWELHEGVLVDSVNQPRQSSIHKPHVNRDVLYGDVFLADIAARILQTIESDGWPNGKAGWDEQEVYSFTVAVHRDWLMTPREDLGGRTPRDLLHGAIEWSDRVTQGQQFRFADDAPLVAAPDDWEGFATAPVGSQEMCMYFDLCREVISAGWKWVESEDGKLARHTHEAALSRLPQFLRNVKEAWLSSPFEGGASPSYIIECDRRRVPYAAGVAIEGIEAVVPEQHNTNCECPICEMMADGMFGVMFNSIDGHHLELDNEFAFSMHATREAWEEEQREFAESELS